jgi:hypothetical protein
VPTPGEGTDGHHRCPLGPGRGRDRLRLRTVISNSDFEEYWEYHPQREHLRVTPSRRPFQSPASCRRPESSHARHALAPQTPSRATWPEPSAQVRKAPTRTLATAVALTSSGFSPFAQSPESPALMRRFRRSQACKVGLVGLEPTGWPCEPTYAGSVNWSNTITAARVARDQRSSPSGSSRLGCPAIQRMWKPSSRAAMVVARCSTL